jgi:hypothetical protein
MLLAGGPTTERLQFVCWPAIKRVAAVQRLQSAENAKHQGDHDRKDDRGRNREINADVSVWALVFDIAWQERKSGRYVVSPGVGASIREPTNEGKSQNNADKDCDKCRHGAAGRSESRYAFNALK